MENSIMGYSPDSIVAFIGYVAMPLVFSNILAIVISIVFLKKKPRVLYILPFFLLVLTVQLIIVQHYLSIAQNDLYGGHLIISYIISMIATGLSAYLVFPIISFIIFTKHNSWIKSAGGVAIFIAIGLTAIIAWNRFHITPEKTLSVHFKIIDRGGLPVCYAHVQTSGLTDREYFGNEISRVDTDDCGRLSISGYGDELALHGITVTGSYAEGTYRINGKERVVFRRKNTDGNEYVNINAYSYDRPYKIVVDARPSLPNSKFPPSTTPP